jgi:hypothetical protein
MKKTQIIIIIICGIEYMLHYKMCVFLTCEMRKRVKLVNFHYFRVFI